MGQLLKETFVSSSLLLMKRKGEVCIKSSNHSLILLLLLCCCDVDPVYAGPYMKQLCNQQGLKIFRQNIQGLESSDESLSQISGSNNIYTLTLSETHVIENKDLVDKN